MAVPVPTNNAVTQEITKEVYEKSVKKLLPNGLKFTKMVEFSEADRLGDEFVASVELTHEQGFSYSAADDPVALQVPVSSTTKYARVAGSQMFLRMRCGQRLMDQARGNNKAAFTNSMTHLIANGQLTMRKRLEIDCLYGRSGIGIVGVPTVGAGGNVIITAAEWAPGIWAGMEGAIINFFAADLTTERGTITVGTTALGDGDHIVSGINIDTRTITFDAVHALVAAGDIAFFRGQLLETGAHQSMLGLHGILAAPTTLFGITTASFSLWRPATHALSAAQLAFEHVNRATYKSISRGNDESMDLLINAGTWTDLLKDEASLRRHQDPNKRRYSVGGEGIEFYGMTGPIMIQPSIYVKQGFGYLIPRTGSWKRIGSTDIQMLDPTGGSGQYLWVTDQSGVELRMNSDQAVFSTDVGKAVRITGIVNT